MVCPRCILAVENELQDLGHNVVHLALGEAEINGELSPLKLSELDSALQKLGFELITDRKTRISIQVKNEIINLVHYSPKKLVATNLSAWLSSRLAFDYTYLSNTFSETECTTIEKFYIAQRIEKVKELLEYGELTLSQIADTLGYSSTAYLSSQFKKVTGITPTAYKAQQITRKSLDKL